MKRREPPKIATSTAKIKRKLAFLLRVLSAGSRILPVASCCGKTCSICVIRSCLIDGTKLLKINPAMAMRAMTMGKIAVMRLNANPAAKFMTQSLLNLVQKSCKDLIPFSAAFFASEVSCGSL